MEAEAEAGDSKGNECKKNLGLGDKQKKRKRSGKKKKAKKQENEFKNNDDSVVISQSGNDDEAGLSKERKETEKSISEDQVQPTLPSESCQRDSVSCEESGSILHDKDSSFQSTKDSVPDANGNGAGTKRSRRKDRKKKKKKEDSSCEEKMLDDAEKTTNEDQDLCENPVASQLCTGPDLSMREDSRPDATDMICSLGRKRQKKRDRSTLKESDVDSNSTNAQVAARCSIVSEPEGSKSVSIEGKTGCLESKDDTVGNLESTSVELSETVSQRSPKAKKKKKKRTKTMEVCEQSGNTLASKIEDSATEKDALQNVENTKKKKKHKKKKVDQDALGAEGISNVEVKTTEDSATEGKSNQNVKNGKTKKKDKKVNRDASEAEGVSKVEGTSVQNDQNALGADGISNVEVKTTEDSTTERKSNQNVQNAKTKNKDKKVNRDASEAEGVSKVEGTSVQNDQDALEAGVSKAEVKTKKKRKKNRSKKKENLLDHKPDNMEDKDAVSLPRNDEELVLEKENLEASLSSTVLIHNNVAHGVAPPEIGDVPTCSCTGQRAKKLVVFDLNGILADIVQGVTGEFIPDGRVSYRSVFLRPFVHSFLDFCFERFDIGVWSSRRIGLDYMTNLVMKNHARNLLFCFGQNVCTTTTFKTLENSTKPIFLKDLRRVWERFGTCSTCRKRKYDETNTLLVDDSPDKSLCNPPYTGIFPRSYQYTDREDSELGPEGELRKYLERLADATNVQKFVAENPYGQAAITETHESWEFYSKVVEAYRVVN